MKKLVFLIMLSIPAWCMAAQLDKSVNRAAAKALAKTAVRVQVQLAKPVYMSEVMFRRPRTQDTVISVDYKQVICTGRLSSQKTHVYVPLACVQDEKYKAASVRLTFADGQQVKKSGKDVEMQAKFARIRI